jgi:hypothetical protein
MWLDKEAILNKNANDQSYSKQGGVTLKVILGSLIKAGA